MLYVCYVLDLLYEIHILDHMAKATTSPKRTPPLQLVCSPEFLRMIDDWRRKQPEIPNRSVAIRRLVEIGVAADTDPRRKP